MKNFNYSLTFLAIFALLLTSCSKEETDVSGIDGQDTFQLQFNANLNDFNRQQQTKDHLSDDPVVCRDADPAYVLVALTDSNGDWVADKNPEPAEAGVDDFIRLDLKLNGGGWETLYSPMLGLPAGTYNLEYFIVYSADDQVLWVAPREGGAYEGSVGDPLPQSIVLGAGTKPYVEVDVLCYVPRMEEAYGHIFFDINAIAIESNYCIFVNYCDDGTGREYPAMFEVDVWGDDYDGSDVVVDGAMNSVSGTGNDFAATVLCMALPPLGEGEVYYVRVTVLDAGDYDADASDFVEFTITQADIDGQPAEVPAYEHLRINCEDDDGGNGCDVNDDLADCDNDTVPNGEDMCPGFDDREDLDGDNMPDACDNDRDGDGIDNDADTCPDDLPGEGYVDEDGDGCDDGDPCANLPAVCSIPQVDDDLTFGCVFAYFDPSNVDDFLLIQNAEAGLQLEEGFENSVYGLVNTSISNGSINLSIDGSEADDLIIAYEVEVRPSIPGGGMSSSCWESDCDPDVIASDAEDRDQDPINLSFSALSYEYPYYIRVKVISCAAQAGGI